jgi:hypothetical protein
MTNSDENEGSRPNLPLHTSQSVPILYRSTSSFHFDQDTDTAEGNENGTHSRAGPLNEASDSASTTDADVEDDDDDTFENNCDIEDQATTSSFSMTSFSAMSSRFGRSSQASLAAEATSSDSEDTAPHSALFYGNSFRPTYLSRNPCGIGITRTDSGSGSKIRLSDSSLSTHSSVGTFSKHKHLHPHGHNHYNTDMPVLDGKIPVVKRKQKAYVSLILILIKAIALFWIASAALFLIYHIYIYDDSTSLPMTPLAKLTPGKHNINHIPFPPSEHKVSVVLMNHSRPRMIKESTLVPTLLQHPSVEEVVLLHTNPKTAFKFVHPKVVNVDATKENDQMGLSVRFYFCQLVKSDWVLHVDDDMEFTEKTLNEMLSEFSKNTHRIVGRFGRNRKENSSFNGYCSKDTSKESEVILTKFMVMERDTCSAFFKYSHLIWEDVILNNGEGPLWNGEDIFMSLVSNHVYDAGSENINYAMDWLDVRSAPEELKDYTDGKFDISGGFSGLRFWSFGWWRSLLNRNRHYSYRGVLWKQAKERLELSEPYVR